MPTYRFQCYRKLEDSLRIDLSRAYVVDVHARDVLVARKGFGRALSQVYGLEENSVFIALTQEIDPKSSSPVNPRSLEAHLFRYPN